MYKHFFWAARMVCFLLVTVLISTTWTMAESETPQKTEEGSANQVRLTLNGAIQEALENNLELKNQGLSVESAHQDLIEAYTGLVPQLNLSVFGKMLDQNRIGQTFGTGSQHAVTGSVSLTQPLISEPTWADITISKDLQQAHQHDLEAGKLDTALAAANAYLNVLHVQSLERIRNSNLQLTRTNLEAARTREQSAMPETSDVPRWETELAGRQVEYLSTVAEHKQAMRELLRLLHRPQSQEIVVEDVRPDDSSLSTGNPQLDQALKNMEELHELAPALISNAQTAAPEIHQLNATRAAQERRLTSARLAYFVPTLSLVGGVNQILYSEGQGGAGDFSGNGIVFPKEPNDTEWLVGLQLSLPLLNGGSQITHNRKVVLGLTSLRFQEEAARDRIDERVRDSLTRLESSIRSVQLARSAIDPARKRLDETTAAYGRGSASFLELFDAQQAFLNASLLKVNADYVAMSNLMEALRAAGRFPGVAQNPEP